MIIGAIISFNNSINDYFNNNSIVIMIVFYLNARTLSKFCKEQIKMIIIIVIIIIIMFKQLSQRKTLRG